jgi:type IV pilus assembly protein PilB
MAVRLGELLLREKRITPAQLQEALNHQKANGGKLGMTLVKLGMVKDEEITALLSRQYGVPFINLAQFDIDASVLKLIPAETAQKYQIVPIGRSGATLTIAMTDPTNVFALDDIKFMTGYNVEPVVASETAVGEAIHKYSQGVGGARAGGNGNASSGMSAANAANTLDLATRSLEDSVQDEDVEVVEELEELDVNALEKQGGEAPVIRMVNLLLISSIQKGASDIHIERYVRE